MIRYIILAISVMPLGALGDELDLETVINQVQRAELALVNIHVQASLSGYVWNGERQEYEHTSAQTMKAYYVGLPGNKVRMELSRSDRGRDDTFETSSTIYAFDGQASRQLTGPPGTPHNPPTVMNRGYIFAERPEMVKMGGIASLWRASLYGVGDHWGMRLSELLTSELGHNTVITAVRSDVNGLSCIKIELTDDTGSKLVWHLDDSRDYALLQFTMGVSDGTITERIVVDELVNPSPGIHYPSKVRRYLGSGESPRFYEEGELSAVVVNDPEFADSLFTIKWPAGTWVADERTGHVFLVGEEDEFIERTIRDQVAILHRDLAVQLQHGASDAVMSAETGPSALDVEGEDDAERVSSMPESTRYLLLIIPLLFAVVAALLFRIRRRRGSDK